MRYKQLKIKREQLLAEAKAVLNAAGPAGETEEQQAERTAKARARASQIAQVEIPAIDAELADFDAVHALERATPAAGVNVGSTGQIAVHDRSEDDPMRGFAHAADFGRAVRSACLPGGYADPRLAALYRRNEGPMHGAGQLNSLGIAATAPTGFHAEGHTAEGYLVPPAVRQQMFELIFNGDDLLGLVNSEPTESNAVELLADESTPWGATGIQAAWRPEGGKMDPSKLNQEPRLVRLHSAYAFATATEELLADAPRLSARLQGGASKALRWLLSASLMRGTGTGQPLGWLNSPALITVAKEGTQGAATFLAKNITKMYARMLDNPGANWVWLIRRNVLPQLIDLKIGNEPAWTSQNRGLAEAPGGFLLGVPIIFTRHCSTLGTVGDVQLIDLNAYYAISKSAGVEFASSIHLYFDYGLKAFRWMVRFGGQPFLSAPVAAPDGDADSTESSFIALATRA